MPQTAIDAALWPQFFASHAAAIVFIYAAPRYGRRRRRQPRRACHAFSSAAASRRLRHFVEAAPPYASAV